MNGALDVRLSRFHSSCPSLAPVLLTSHSYLFNARDLNILCTVRVSLVHARMDANIHVKLKVVSSWSDRRKRKWRWVGFWEVETIWWHQRIHVIYWKGLISYCDSVSIHQIPNPVQRIEEARSNHKNTQPIDSTQLQFNSIHSLSNTKKQIRLLDFK